MTKQKQIFALGEVLFDVFPDKERLGGAPFNFIYHLHQFGLKTHFISRVGQDESGKKILKFMKKHKMFDDGIQVDPQYLTGRVEVAMERKGGHVFSILENRAFDHLEYIDDYFKNLSQPDLLYFGSLAQRSEASRKTIRQLIKVYDRSFKFLDINLRPPYYSKDIIEESLKQCHILKLNEDELKILQDWFHFISSDLKEALHKISHHFGIQTVCLTLGEKGSVLFHKKKFYERSPEKVQNIVDTVGAGDAFASVLAMGLLNDWSGDLILERASQFASEICKIAGAIPDGKGFYDKLSGYS